VSGLPEAGLRALVTGASSGIGRALAQRLGARGAHVVLVARRRAELEAAAEEVRAGGGEATVLPCDVGEQAAVEAAAREALAALGGIDLLVSNAGAGGHRPFLAWTPQEIERLMRVQYLGATWWIRALLPAMRAQGRGWLLLMSSIAARMPPPGEAPYAAAKAAVAALAESLSHELEPEGIHVLCVHPGTVRTPFFSAAHLARLPRVARRSMLEPQAVADAALAALARGERRLTVPRWMALGPLARELAPGLARRGMRRATRSAPEE
jgi:short-subunit dehydrogenase